jgi:hypothetical protein
MRRPITMQPIGNMNNVIRPKRVASSTAPAKPQPSSSSSYSPQDAGGWYAENLDTALSGMDKHVLTMLDDLGDAEADQAISDYF